MDGARSGDTTDTLHTWPRTLRRVSERTHASSPTFAPFSACAFESCSLYRYAVTCERVVRSVCYRPAPIPCRTRTTHFRHLNRSYQLPICRVPNLDIKTPQEVVRSRADTPCVVACGLPRVRYAALAATSVAASGGADVDVRRPHAATFAISTLVNVYCKQG